MRVIWVLTVLLLVTACSVGGSPEIVPSPFPSPKRTPLVTETPVVTATVKAMNTLVATEQSEVLCNALEAFCILDGHFVLQRPIHAPGITSVESSYLYGSTQKGARDPHHGVEFENPTGTPVHVAAAGKVVFAGSDWDVQVAARKNFYGNVVVVKHTLEDVILPVYTLYGHLSRVDVRIGQVVEAGEVIGLVGSSGVALGSHLHFEVRVGENTYGATRNPELWLAVEPGTGVLAVSVQTEAAKIVSPRVDMQYISGQGKPFVRDYRPEAYVVDEKESVNRDDTWQEIFAMSGLPEGRYRLGLAYNGLFYERLVDVKSGKLTLAVFVVK